jgi:predicted glycoside hydrolase/deacetylase ChbG (UPF0249 family)
MAQLLVNADDFGLHVAVNTAIEKCIDFGSVNSVSVIANGAESNYELLRQFADKKVFTGVHLTWVGEPWITENIFVADWMQLAKRVIFEGKNFKSKMCVEAGAQIKRLQENRIKLDHIDSHQHVHHLPGIWDMVVELKEKYGIPRIRVAHVKNASLRRPGIAGFTLNYLAKQEVPFSCAGIKHAGNYDRSLFAEELNICTNYNTELIVHPGANNDALNQQYKSWDFNWEKEFDGLLSPGFLQAVADNHFTLIKRP